MTDFLHTGLVLEHEPGRFLVGFGPLDAAAEPAPDRTAFYLPDFWLSDPQPWRHPAAVEALDARELTALLGEPAPMPAVWETPNAERYAVAFDAIMGAIGDGTISKAVPVVFERGRTRAATASLVSTLLPRLLESPGPRWLYGWWDGEAGMLGASPELLFRLTTGTVATQAIAGTAPAAEAERLLDDAKELAEHQSVVDDITEALAPLGQVASEPRTLLCLPDLAHLRTDLLLTTNACVTFMQLVEALHPTAALGVAPRRAGLDLLHRLDDGGRRGRFGAPFGVRRPDGAGLCVVAIRNVQWDRGALSVGAGGGVIARSTLQREWDEITLKHDAVRRMLGL